MMKHKKLMVVAILAALVVVVVAFSATAFAGSSDDNETFISKVADTLGVDDDEVSEAMDQARQEMREEAQQEALAQAVEDGVLTQDEADEIQAWWDARPEVLDDVEVRQALHPRAGHGMRGHCGAPGHGMWGGDIEQLLDEAVDRGLITQEEADQMLSVVEAEE